MGLPPLQAAAAALVLPEHPEVVAIKNAAVSQLATILGERRPSLANCVGGLPQQRRQVVQAVFHSRGEGAPRAPQGPIGKPLQQVRALAKQAARLRVERIALIHDQGPVRDDLVQMPEDLSNGRPGSEVPPQAHRARAGDVRVHDVGREHRRERHGQMSLPAPEIAGREVQAREHWPGRHLDHA